MFQGNAATLEGTLEKHTYTHTHTHTHTQSAVFLKIKTEQKPTGVLLYSKSYSKTLVSKYGAASSLHTM